MSRRPGLDVALAVLLPVACVLALLVVTPDHSGAGSGPAAPAETPLGAATLVCPAALPGGADAVGVTTLAAPDAKGDIGVGLGAVTTPLRVRTGRVAAAGVPDGGPLVVGAEGALAPALAAGRSRSAPLAAVDCAPPGAELWFTGAGASPTHDSVLELVNPDASAASVDVVVRSPAGVLDVPALRGVTVPPGAATRVDLGAALPRRGELALEVHTSRGRVGVHVVDGYDQLGAGSAAQDWLPAQDGPAPANLLLGLAAGAGERTLVLANPGTDEVLATVKVVTPTATFAPAGVEPVRVAPGSTEAISLSAVLQQATADGATGLLVESDAPLGAGLRQVVDGDLSLLAALPAVSGPTAAVVPPVVAPGQARLLVSAGPIAGAATLTAYGPRGVVLATQRVDLVPDTGADVPLPDGTGLVTVAPEGTTVRGVILVRGAGESAGTAVVGLRELATTELVPAVRPGLP